MGPAPVRITAGDAELDGDLTLPDAARGIVVFAHGSGSSRRSPRNREVAEVLVRHGFATLLFDLLTSAEEQIDVRTRELRFDIGLLARRLEGATAWVRATSDTASLPLGYFGASTGAAAALAAAAARPDDVQAVVSRGGRPDLAGEALARVGCPVLLVVGGADDVVLGLNRDAADRLAGDVDLQVVPGAGHLFEEPGALDRVCALAAAFFSDHLRTGGGAS